MPFTLLQVAGTLKSINTDGVLSSALTLPTGVQIAINRTPRFARFKRFIVLVNTPTSPLSIGPDGVVRLLTPVAPTTAVALSDGAAGTLSGTYLALQTYRMYDTDGNLVTESDYGPAMTTAVTITNKKLHAAFTAAPTGEKSQIYRTVTNGSTYFTWGLVAAGTATLENDDSDSSLGQVAAGELGTAPDLTLIAAWQGRLWGVSRTEIENLRYTESGTMYAWSALNDIPIGKVGEDETGITALIPRRNSLGVAKKNQFLQISGTSRTNFVQTNINDNCGCDSQESVAVFRDTAFFLWHDGVYTWNDDGFKCITNGLTRSWFNTDDTFNRAMFWRSFAVIDPIALRYRLFLASAESSVIDSWIEYDLSTGKWWGPHSTDAFAPTCALQVYGANQKSYPMIGSTEEYLSKDQETRSDWTSPINFRVRTKAHAGADPNSHKYFGELYMLTKAQDSGILTVTPYVGDLSASAGTPFSYEMVNERKRLGRLGVGRTASLEITNSELDQDVIIYGYEIDPIHEVGNR